jgi:tetrapyrrole methylase family protein/MazG family protein
MTGSITVVGLGPGDPDLRTVGAVRALADAERIVLRTAVHPGIEDIAADPRAVACDDLYETGASFQAVYEAVVERVLAASANLRTVFAVPGHPRFGEHSVDLLVERAAAAGRPLRVIAGVSALDVVATTLGVDPLAVGAQLVDAAELDAWLAANPFGGVLDLSPARPMLIGQVYSREMASAVKLSLSRIFPDDHNVSVVTAAGVSGSESKIGCPLHELDRLPVNHLTSVWVPAQDPLAATRSGATLHRLAAILRSPEGCPWDRKQTHETLRWAAIEEAYEVVDAIDENDGDHLA